MQAKGHFDEVERVMDEHFVSKHAEPVPQADLEKPPSQVFYLLMHVVRKESSTTTKLRAVFDASAKTSSGISLNDIYLSGQLYTHLWLTFLCAFALIALL